MAPPEPDHQPRRKVPRIEGGTQLSSEETMEDQPPVSTNAVRERVRPNASLHSETKRRKVAHTYSKRHSAGGAIETPQNSTQRKENRLPSATKTNRAASDSDIYDMPLDSSPPQRPSTPLVLTNLTQPIQSPGEESLGPTGRPLEKRRGLLAVLDSSSESDPEPSGSYRRARPASPVRERTKPLVITIPSSPPLSSSSSQEEEEEDESQIITKFQRKTNGVLPASWWKLDKNRQTGVGNESRRGQSPPRNDNTPRPGVARARITSRARTPEGVFLLGDESDSSSDEPVIVSSAPARRAEKAAPTREWIDLDDIIEDDKIDRMLPGISRKRKAQTKQRKRVSSNQPSQRGFTAGQTSTPRQGSDSVRLRQPKITDHVSSKKTTRRRKPAAPRVGIIDAVRHHKATATASPPTFIKLATRVARKKKDQGRQSPSRKLFVLETEMDTRDVQAVLRDWREGTLSFAPEHNIGESLQHSRFSHENGASRHQLRLPSPQNLGGSQSHPPRRQPGTSTNTRALQLKRQAGRQTTLSNIIRREPVSKKAASTHLQPKSYGNTVTTMPGRSNFATHRPDFAPQQAQFEVQAPLNNTLRRLHQASRRAPTPDIATLLHYTARRGAHLAGFISNEDLVQAMPQVLPTARSFPAAVPGPPPEVLKPSRPAPRARRKRIPKRVDADTIERRQPPLSDIIIEDVDLHAPEELPRDNKPVLQGLLPYGNKYSLNFDTTPLKPGTIFNSETFIGDGGLSRALNTLPASSSRRNHGSSYTFGDKIVHWGIYEDSVAADFEIIMNQIADTTEKAHAKDDLNGAEFHCLTSQVYSFYMFFSKYLSQIISFLDSIDIISFGQRVLQALDVCCDRVVTTLGGNNSHSSPRSPSTRLKLQLLSFSLVFAFQINQLASGDAQVQARLEVEKSTRKTGYQLVSQLMRCGLDTVRECYEDQRHQNKYERGIDREHYAVEAWVIAIQVLGQVGSPDISFWQLFNPQLRPTDLEKALDIRLFEKHWRMIFSILPLYQFDNLGFIQQPSKEYHMSENWTLLKILVSRPLKIYNANPEAHFGTIIDYCRVLYARCHHLISSWGWTNPDIIIPTLYEFFASNNLANLKNENEYGSAEFLQNLEKTPSLAVQNSDRCFHLLLKTVAIGINSMKATSTTKKIRNLVNRLMPNHRRQYPKEEGLRIEHLTALKNHHDLLATLYWAAPPDCRPHIDAIRNLVDPELSHRRACNVSVRTWSNLLRFQLHSEEDTKSLGPFMEWLDDLVTQTLNQHHTARSEAEKLFQAAKDKGDTELSEDFLETNIRRNQTELEGILNDVVKSLSTALSGIEGQMQSAMAIFTKGIELHILIINKPNSHSLNHQYPEFLQSNVP